jgi:hypothetical protein
MTGTGLDLVSYQDAITAQVVALYPDYDVIEDTLDDDMVLHRDLRGKMPAYIVLRYGPKLPKRRGKSFAGPRHDEYYATVDILAVASKGRIARQLCDAACNDLIGFKPDGVAPMSIQDDGGMFAAFVVSSNEARPTRSLASQRLRFNVNNTNIGGDARPTP